MCKTVSFKVSSGMDSVVRVLTTLRRKQFDVREFTMKEINSNKSEFMITLEDEKNLGVDRAIQQMQKLIDVYDVMEVQ